MITIKKISAKKKAALSELTKWIIFVALLIILVLIITGVVTPNIWSVIDILP
ncbi:hypothetical protein JXB28_00825 [Candidatus Woesearchaeota archaeon]|nr:hypothetical protein [Candidatus Woesearchaeota archaeon]